MKLVGLQRDITEDIKAMIEVTTHKKKINGGKEEMMNINILFMGLNLNLIYGVQESIIMWGEKLIEIRYVKVI